MADCLHLDLTGREYVAGGDIPDGGVVWRCKACGVVVAFARRASPAGLAPIQDVWAQNDASVRRCLAEVVGPEDAGHIIDAVRGSR